MSNLTGRGLPRDVAVNGSGGAFITISATINSRFVTIEEVQPDANPPLYQGLQVQLSDDAFATTYQEEPGSELTFGDKIAFQNNRGSWLFARARTYPGGESKAADIICKLKSQTVTATTVRVTEYA